MSSRFIMLALVAIGLGLIVYFSWTIFNAKNVRARSSHEKKRKSDRIVLNRSQKRVYKDALKLYREGNVRGSAQLLESLNMIREAVSMLEKAGFIKDAANLLMRIRRPNRAGAVYVRHGMWREAASSFAMAGMPLEVARCSREAGDLQTAVEHFIKAEQFKEAAECYLDLGDHRNAARLFNRMGQRSRAIELYQVFLEGADNIQGLDFGEEEIQLIMTYVMRGHTDARLADILVARGRIIEPIVSLLKQGAVREASELYLRNTKDIGPQLISSPEFAAHDDGVTLARLFMAVSTFEYAGMVFERIGDFAQAGQAFENAEDYERAAYCYERAGLQEKAIEARCNLAATGKATPRSSAARTSPSSERKRSVAEQNPFVLGEASSPEAIKPASKANPPIAADADDDDDDEPLAFGDDDDEPTAVLAAAGSFDADKVEDISAAREPLASFDLSLATGAGSIAIDLKPDSLRAAFDQSTFLEDLDTAQKDSIWAIGNSQTFPAGTVLLDFNDDPKGIYFLLSGTASCHRMKGQRELEIDRMSGPTTFGEFWLLVDLPTQVKFVAIDTCQVRWVSREAFNELLDKNGTIARKVYKRFTLRLLTKLVSTENSSPAKRAS